MNDTHQSKGNLYVVGGIALLVVVIFVFAYRDQVVAPTTAVITSPETTTTAASDKQAAPVTETKATPQKTSATPASSVWPSPVSTAPKATSPSGLPTMTYTTGGFNPMVLEIKRGQSVRFVNGSKGSMRLVSNTDGGQNPYPAFSQSKTVGPGGVYEFTFTIPGTWGFKNQFDAAHIGAIAVQ